MLNGNLKYFDKKNLSLRSYFEYIFYITNAVSLVYQSTKGKTYCMYFLLTLSRRIKYF